MTLSLYTGGWPYSFWKCERNTSAFSSAVSQSVPSSFLIFLSDDGRVFERPFLSCFRASQQPLVPVMALLLFKSVCFDFIHLFLPIKTADFMAFLQFLRDVAFARVRLSKNFFIAEFRVVISGVSSETILVVLFSFLVTV